MLVVVLIGIATYLTIRAIQRRGVSPATRRAAPPRPSRPLGPDDDPDFLRDLDRKRKHKHPDDPDPSTG